MRYLFRLLCCWCIAMIGLYTSSFAQFSWGKEGHIIHDIDSGRIISYNLANQQTDIILDLNKYPDIRLESYSFDEQEKKLLIFANAEKVWRYNNKGDYFVYDRTSGKMHALGKGLKPASLLFAKFSPDAARVAYVYEYNIYVEDIATGKINSLTKDGSRKNIYGGFDWVYEEEFGCRDGFRWSPDGKKIAFWYFDASPTKDYLMLNTLDSIYPSIVPVEFPVAGDRPSKFKIGVVSIDKPVIQWVEWKEDEREGSYLPNMEWSGNNELITIHMNRKQQVLNVTLVEVTSGKKTSIYQEQSDTWIDPQPNKAFWNWIENKNAFLWLSEKDGWRHIWKISKDGQQKTLLTNVEYDVIAMDRIDEQNGYVYFYASPFTSYQKYLFRARLDGKGVEQVTTYDSPGYHRYMINGDGSIAYWMPMNHQGYGRGGLVNLNEEVAKAAKGPRQPKPYTETPIRFFEVEIEPGVVIDGMMQLPENFDSTRQYPVLFYVYTEPGMQTVVDMPGAMGDYLYEGSMAKDGYIVITMDNRGTPAPKGAGWRKAIYGKVGQINIDDQAKAARKILEWPFIDKERVGVWGWSGGGSATLHLMFRYPDIYRTGIAIAALTDPHLYDNIYTERYMGLPWENKEGYQKGAVLQYVAGLKGKLLYIHGTGDDNVHINNADLLIDALVREGKDFQMMYYPGRTHAIQEREGTSEHLSRLFTRFIKEHL